MLGHARRWCRSAWQFRQAGSIALQRSSDYAAVTDADRRVFEDIVGATGVVTDPHALQPFNR